MAELHWIIKTIDETWFEPHAKHNKNTYYPVRLFTNMIKDFQNKRFLKSADVRL